MGRWRPPSDPQRKGRWVAGDPRRGVAVGRWRPPSCRQTLRGSLATPKRGGWRPPSCRRNRSGPRVQHTAHFFPNTMMSGGDGRLTLLVALLNRTDYICLKISKDKVNHDTRTLQFSLGEQKAAIGLWTIYKSGKLRLERNRIRAARKRSIRTRTNSSEVRYAAILQCRKEIADLKREIESITTANANGVFVNFRNQLLRSEGRVFPEGRIIKIYEI